MRKLLDVLILIACVVGIHYVQLISLTVGLLFIALFAIVDLFDLWIMEDV